MINLASLVWRISIELPSSKILGTGPAQSTVTVGIIVLLARAACAEYVQETTLPKIGHW